LHAQSEIDLIPIYKVKFCKNSWMNAIKNNL
jgi:hypothetical protein